MIQSDPTSMQYSYNAQPQGQQMNYSMPQGQQMNCPMPQGQQMNYSMPQGQQMNYSMPQGQQMNCPMPQGQQMNCPMPPGQQMNYSMPQGQQMQYEIPQMQNQVMQMPLGEPGQGKIYDVQFEGKDVDIFSNEILFTASIDESLWDELQRGLKRNHSINKGWKMSAFCCTPPWVAHQVIFAPFIWCGPMTYFCLCSPYNVLPMPDGCSNDALVLTTHGIHVHYQNHRDARVGIKWKNVDVEKITIVKGKMNEGLHTPIGFGLLVPCCFYNLSCSGPYDDRLYTIRIPSIYHQEINNKRRGNGGGQLRHSGISSTVVDTTATTLLSVCALGVDAEDLLSKIKTFKDRYRD